MARSSRIKVMMEVKSAVFLPRAEDIVVPKQQISAIERSIALRAEALITARARLGPRPVLMGDTLAGMPAYSRNKISMPTTRFAGGRSGERSAVRRTRFASRMQQVKSRGGLKAKTSGSGPRGKREWVTTDRGYAGIRDMAGIPGNQYFSFTGKMLEDFRVDATLTVNNRMVTYIGDLVRGALYGFRVFGAEGLRQAQGTRAQGGRFGFHPSKGGRDESVPIYTVKLDFGFATEASAKIAGWLHRPGHKAPPRPWVGVAREEALELQAAAEKILSAAAADGRFEDAGEDTNIGQPRGAGGSFIPFVY